LAKDKVYYHGLGPGYLASFQSELSRANYQKYLTKWRWIVVASFVFPLLAITLFGSHLFREMRVLDQSSHWSVPLAGQILSPDLGLDCLLLVLTNLESTFRASSGSIRWQIKFTVLGLAGIFAVRIFTVSQTILFNALNSSMEAFDTIAVMVSDILIAYSFVRSRLLKVDIYLSETMLHRSLTFLIAGMYLVFVGILTKVLTYLNYLNGQGPLFMSALFVFLALIGLMVILLSEELRQQIRRFIYAHFQRPRYDYRKEWSRFTQRTASILDSMELCGAVAKMVSETFGVSSTTLWLVNETRENLIFAGSTSLLKHGAVRLRLRQVAQAFYA